MSIRAVFLAAPPILFGGPKGGPRLFSANMSSSFPHSSNFFASMILKPSFDAYRKAHKLNVDVFWLDLEDGAPRGQKPIVRTWINQALAEKVFDKKRVIIRLNGLDDHKDLQEDLKCCIMHHEKIFGFALPMLRSGQDVISYEKEITAAAGKHGIDFSNSEIKLFPIIETARAVVNLKDIASASNKIFGMYFGDADLSVDLGAENTRSNLAYARQAFVLNAVAADVLPIDGAYTKIDDTIGLERESKASKALGFIGRACVHPNQLETLRTVYGQTKKNIEWALKVKEAMSKRSDTVQMHDQASRDFIGPPHFKLAEEILASQNDFSKTNPRGVQPFLTKGGMDLEALKSLGLLQRCQFDLSITDGFLSNWESIAFASNSININTVFAKSLGFQDRVIPNSLLMTLAVSLAVTKLTELAKVHLVLKNAHYLSPVYPGDTIRGYFSVISVKSSQSGKGSIVQTQHILKNQHNKKVYQLEKWTLFPDMNYEGSFDNPEDVIPIDKEAQSRDLESFSFSSSYLNQVLHTDYFDYKRSEKTISLDPGRVLIHRLGKAFGKSEVRQASYSIRVTNAHHYDPTIFNEQELLVPGPLSIASTLACASLDFGEVLYESILECTNIQKVNLEDSLHAMTFIKSRKMIDHNKNLESVRCVTIGIKGINVTLLEKNAIPLELFDNNIRRPKQFNDICSANIPMLLNRVVCRTEYEILKLR